MKFTYQVLLAIVLYAIVLGIVYIGGFWLITGNWLWTAW